MFAVSPSVQLSSLLRFFHSGSGMRMRPAPSPPRASLGNSMPVGRSRAKRFALDRPTGIELPNEARGGDGAGRILIPDPEWKKRRRDESWTDGDTANMSIGQGYLLVTPLQMACYTAS